MDEKRCANCLITKSLDAFSNNRSKKDGKQCWCKICIFNHMSSPENKTKQKEYAKGYLSKAENQLKRVEYLAKPETKAKLVKHRSKYLSKTETKLKRNEIARKYRDDNPEKYKAYAIVKYSINKGDLVRQPCEWCGSTDNVHAHHDDYSKPLEVMWLCGSGNNCHGKRHHEK